MWIEGGEEFKNDEKSTCVLLKNAGNFLHKKRPKIFEKNIEIYWEKHLAIL